MVKINCMGGGGYFSDDVSAKKSQVVKGCSTITSDQNDEIVEGTMIDVASNDANVGKYVEYSDITELANGKTIYSKCILYFEDTDYESTTSLTNDYYIISGDNKISPLDLKVGDKIYFELITILETAPGKAYGHYLYLCN